MKTALFRNADSALASVRAIDYCPSEVNWEEHNSVVKAYTHGELYDVDTKVTSWKSGKITVPEHYATTGKWLNYLGVTCATTSTYTHTFTDASSAYYFTLHGELEHTTTAQNYIRDFHGCYVASYRMTFGQKDAATQTVEVNVAKAGSGGNVARPSTLDYRDVFTAGCYSAKVQYNSTSLGITVLGGWFEKKLTWDEYKVGDTLVTDASIKRKDFKVGLTVRPFNKTIFGIPKDPASYATAIMVDLKIWKNGKKTTQYIQLSCNNMFLEDRPWSRNIDENAYFYEREIVFKISGKSAGTLSMKCVDDLSAKNYETAG